MINTIIYTRVSGSDSLKSSSSDLQLSACKKYAKEQGWNVVKVFEDEVESVKSADRTKLLELIDYCSTNKGKVVVCLVYKLGCFARNQIELYAIKATLLKYGVSVRSATEPVDDTSIGKVIEGLLHAITQIESEIRQIRSERIKRGLRARKQTLY